MLARHHIYAHHVAAVDPQPTAQGKQHKLPAAQRQKRVGFADAPVVQAHVRGKRAAEERPRTNSLQLTTGQAQRHIGIGGSGHGVQQAGRSLGLARRSADGRVRGGLRMVNWPVNPESPPWAQLGVVAPVRSSTYFHVRLRSGPRSALICNPIRRSGKIHVVDFGQLGRAGDLCSHGEGLALLDGVLEPQVIDAGLLLAFRALPHHLVLVAHH